MIITLNPNLELYEDRYPTSVEKFLGNLVYSAELKNVKPIGMTLSDNAEKPQSGWFGMLADAYSRHEKMRIAPHDLWFIVLGEIARFVNSNSQACRHLFTNKTEGKTDIVVHTSDITHLPIDQVMEQLRQNVPSDISAFIPSTLSTLTPDIEVAMNAMFCDMVKTYYSYMTLLCGLPEIEVTGTLEDWSLLSSMTVRLQELFGTGKMHNYLDRVKTIVDRFIILKSKSAPDADDVAWMKDIYSHRNVGSGSQKEVDGWIRNLYMENSQRRFEAFQFSKAIVPYKNLTTGLDFTAVYGGFSRLRSSTGFVYTGYEHAVFQHLPV